MGGESRQSSREPVLLGYFPGARSEYTLTGPPITAEMRQAATVQGADHPGVRSMAHHELLKCGSLDPHFQRFRNSLE